MINFLFGLIVGVFFEPMLARLVADWSKLILQKKLTQQLEILDKNLQHSVDAELASLARRTYREVPKDARLN